MTLSRINCLFGSSHFRAPPSKSLPELLIQFVAWYQDFEDKEFGKIGDAMISSALAHLYFETLHPFEDDR